MHSFMDQVSGPASESRKEKSEKYGYIIRASLRETLSLGFATRVDSNRPAQLQRLARGLKFCI